VTPYGDRHFWRIAEGDVVFPPEDLGRDKRTIEGGGEETWLTEKGPKRLSWRANGLMPLGSTDEETEKGGGILKESTEWCLEGER